MNTVFRHKYCTTSCPNRTIQGQRSRPVLAQASVSKELLSRRGTAYTYEHSQRTPARQLSQRLKVISLVADCVQINVSSSCLVLTRQPCTHIHNSNLSYQTECVFEMN